MYAQKTVSNPAIFESEVDSRLIESLQTLIDFVGNTENYKTRVVAGILAALWDESNAVPRLQYLGLLDPVTFEHVINVIRLAATGTPIDRHVRGGAEVFEGIAGQYGFRRPLP